MSGSHPLIDGGQVEHAGSWVRSRETASQECGQLGLKFCRGQVQAPGGFLNWYVARLYAEADLV
jgi:hypothetical protein